MSTPAPKLEDEVKRLLAEPYERVAYERTPVQVGYFVLDCQRLIRLLWRLVPEREEEWLNMAKMEHVHTVRSLGTMKIRVRLSGPLRFRLWLGLRVLNLATAILGVGYDAEVQEMESSREQSQGRLGSSSCSATTNGAGRRSAGSARSA